MIMLQWCLHLQEVRNRLSLFIRKCKCKCKMNEYLIKCLAYFVFCLGTIVTLTMSRSAQYGYDQRIEVFGTEGLAAVGNQHSNSSLVANSHGFQQPKLKYSFPERFNQAFYSELDAFADTVLYDKEWPITREDCINVQKVADAAKKSSEENRVIHLL